MRPSLRAMVEALMRIAAMVAMTVTVASPWIAPSAVREDIEMRPVPAPRPADGAGQKQITREVLLAFYVGQPLYNPSDVDLRRPDQTDLRLKRVNWDGDALYFPIDGGVRSVEWWGPLGFSIDFLHNKAIAQLGFGAHGRKLARPVIQTVPSEGTVKGRPATAHTKLTDVFDRLEFTHGHNMLFATPMLRLGAITPSIRPYVGVGGGIAMPHVEIWFKGVPDEPKTNEYQYGGPAVQAMAGVEFRIGGTSVFLEYKYSFAWIKAALTGGKSWKNFNLPGDLINQFSRWWSGTEAPLGTVSTTLSAHNFNIGIGRWVGWPPNLRGGNQAVRRRLGR